MKVVEFVEGLVINHNGVSIVFDFSVLDKLFQEVSMTNEGGGVFYGYKIIGIQEYRLLGFTEPFGKDKRRQYRFDRLDTRHIEFIKKEWINDKSIMYLGDWHSHPAEESNPSLLDINTWTKISKKAKTNASILIFSIISKNELLNCIYSKKGEEIFRFKIITIKEKRYKVI